MNNISYCRLQSHYIPFQQLQNHMRKTANTFEDSREQAHLERASLPYLGNIQPIKPNNW